MKTHINILLYQSSKPVDAKLEIALWEERFSTIFFSNIEQAYNDYCSTPTHLCLINLSEDLNNGILLANMIKQQDNQAAIIFFSHIPDREEVIAAFQAGADDYIRQPIDPQEVIARIKAVLKRTDNKPVNKKTIIYKLGLFTFNTNKQTLTFDQEEEKLTTKEYELLLLFCKNVNSLVDRTHALQKIWNNDSHFNARSMDVYITKLRQKLKKDPRIKIINIHGKGYKLEITE